MERQRWEATMAETQVYATLIHTTPDTLWDASPLGAWS